METLKDTPTANQAHRDIYREAEGGSWKCMVAAQYISGISSLFKQGTLCAKKYT